MSQLKNPNRQVAQYRLMIDRQRRLLRYVALFWLLPALLLIAAILREWHWLLSTLFAIALLSGVAQHVNEWTRLRDYESKKANIEESHG